jgi:hypothetical protein
MSSDSMLIHAGARQLCCVIRVLCARRIVPVHARRARLARPGSVVCGWLVATKAEPVGSSYRKKKPEKAASSWQHKKPV